MIVSGRLFYSSMGVRRVELVAFRNRVLPPKLLGGSF